jgi:TrmH family RNA methyltransferase
VIRDIAGRQNHSVKLAHKLQKKKHRRERGLLVCEGMDLLLAAVAAGADIRDVLVRSDLFAGLPAELRKRAVAGGEGPGVVDIGVCDQETLDYAGSLGGAADVIFTCAQPLWSLAGVDLGGRVTLYLDGVGDPGNVGALVRSAVAFGVVGMICSPGTADPYGPKAMRAGMGAQFALPVVVEVAPGDLVARLAALAERGLKPPEILVADPHDGEDVREVDAREGAVLVLGEERGGPGPGWAGRRRVCIPQAEFDSLNVAMAGTVLAYEMWRKGRDLAVANGQSVR